MENATFAGGCFWCTEAIFQRLKGVYKVTPGYSGGSVDNPTYEEVSSGTTGHTEAVQIEFNPNVISYEELLSVFFATHDPTSVNRQGGDVGTQYRSAIFYHTDSQRQAAEKLVRKIPNAVTQISMFTKFYPAEAAHKDYYNRNRSAAYCVAVIDPKIKKLLSEFEEKIKTDT